MALGLNFALKDTRMMKKMMGSLKCKCPNCEKGNIFSEGGNILLLKMPKMNDRCVECDYKFEREPGFFFGAMYVSYGLAAAQMMISILIMWLVVDLDLSRVFVLSVMIAFLLSAFNFKLSRSIWIHIFY